MLQVCRFQRHTRDCFDGEVPVAALGQISPRRRECPVRQCTTEQFRYPFCSIREAGQIDTSRGCNGVRGLVEDRFDPARTLVVVVILSTAQVEQRALIEQLLLFIPGQLQ